jgi:2-methylisocitrate lyase-like PEP mutase family enzyme
MTGQTESGGHDVAADAGKLRKLHVPGDPLLLANVWDPTSARVVESAGMRGRALVGGGLAAQRTVSTAATKA